MTIPLEQAQQQLAQLLDRLAAGEELVITRGGQPVARIVPERGGGGSGAADGRVNGAHNPDRVLGSAKGLIHISDDFDAPLDEFREYME
jgi:prevent-host-death family protein